MRPEAADMAVLTLFTELAHNFVRVMPMAQKMSIGALHDSASIPYKSNRETPLRSWQLWQGSCWSAPMAITSLKDALRWFSGGDKKEKPLFKSEKEAYDFCRSLYNKSGGATADLRRAYAFYLKNYNDGYDVLPRPERNSDIAPKQGPRR
jgi:hypothetical protein